MSVFLYLLSSTTRQYFHLLFHSFGVWFVCRGTSSMFVFMLKIKTKERFKSFWALRSSNHSFRPWRRWLFLIIHGSVWTHRWPVLYLNASNALHQSYCYQTVHALRSKHAQRQELGPLKTRTGEIPDFMSWSCYWYPETVRTRGAGPLMWSRVCDTATVLISLHVWLTDLYIFNNKSMVRNQSLFCNDCIWRYRGIRMP